MSRKPEIPINVADLKQILRDGLEDQTTRAFWWPILPGVRSDQKRIEEDPDIIGTAERLKELLNEPMLEHNPSAPVKFEKDIAAIEQVVKKISFVLVQQKKIEEKDLGYIETLLRLIIWQVNRIDVGYWMANEILSKPDRYNSFGPSHAFSMYFTFKELLKSHMPKTYVELNEIGALDEKYLSMMFIDLFVELLPPKLLLPLLDAYFLEGVKVLYRYGIALITGYKSAIKKNEYNSAKEFWLSIKSDCFTASNFSHNIAKALGIEEVLPMVDQFVVLEHSNNTQEFLASAQIRSIAFQNDRSALAKAMKPMNISRNNLETLHKAAHHREPRDLQPQRRSISLAQPSQSQLSSVNNTRRLSLTNHSPLSTSSPSPLAANGGSNRFSTTRVNSANMSPTKSSNLKGMEERSLSVDASASEEDFGGKGPLTPPPITIPSPGTTVTSGGSARQSVNLTVGYGTPQPSTATSSSGLPRGNSFQNPSASTTTATSPSSTNFAVDGSTHPYYNPNTNNNTNTTATTSINNRQSVNLTVGYGTPQSSPPNLTNRMSTNLSGGPGAAGSASRYGTSPPSTTPSGIATNTNNRKSTSFTGSPVYPPLPPGHTPSHLQPIIPRTMSKNNNGSFYDAPPPTMSTDLLLDDDALSANELNLIQETMAERLVPQSTIFTNKESFFTFCSLIPESMLSNHGGLELIYQSLQHGQSIASLYQRIATLEPTIVVIRLGGVYQDIVLGGVCSAPLAPPNSQPRGQGMFARVFRMSLCPNASEFTTNLPPYAFPSKDRSQGMTAYAYDWIGLHDETLLAVAATTTSPPASEKRLSMRSSGSSPTAAVSATNDVTGNRASMNFTRSGQTAKKQLVIADRHSILFGSSALYATAAIRIDSDLRYVYTGPSDTYDNAPLLLPSKNASLTEAHSYPIAAIEIYVGAFSIQRHDSA